MNEQDALPPMHATILAAGQGSRMGHRPKANIPVGGRTVLEWQVAALRGAGIEDITVVVGTYLKQLKPLVASCGAHMVVNESKDSDLATSQHTAIRAHRERNPGTDMLLLLGDLPLLRAHHILDLINAWFTRDHGVQALVPSVGDVRGHPVLLSWEAIQRMTADGNPEGIRAWMSQNKESVRFITLNDPAYIQDLDTPSDIDAVSKLIRVPRV